MAHISSPEENEVLIKRVRRIAGQIEALERAIKNQAECGDILHLAAAARGAMNGLLDEVLEAHLREHVAKPGLSDKARKAGAEDIMQAIKRYAK